MFDFNGDKKAEVVYRDECFLCVMDGTNGKTVFAQQITSGTCLENPVMPAPGSALDDDSGGRGVHSPIPSASISSRVVMASASARWYPWDSA